MADRMMPMRAQPVYLTRHIELLVSIMQRLPKERRRCFHQGIAKRLRYSGIPYDAEFELAVMDAALEAGIDRSELRNVVLSDDWDA
jgi:hypothetical protein